jgi:hypothetical protein
MEQALASESAAELLGWSPRLSGHTLADGTPVKAYVRFSPEGATISDLGATLSGMGELPVALRAAVLEISGNNDLQLDGEALLAHLPPGGEVGEAVDRLGRACAQISRTASADASPPP